MRYILVSILLFLSGCTGVPSGIEPIQNLEVNRYLGKWYELARLDHSFERGLQAVSATYSLREGGGIKVMNKGFNEIKNKWKDAEGKAFFVGDKNVGHLKVSFFGPFYASYIVFELGEDYDYAFVTSSDKSYLWLLSRKPDLNDDLKNKFIERVSELDFDLKKIIYVKH